MMKFISKKAKLYESSTYFGEHATILGPSYVGEGCFIGPYVIIGYPKMTSFGNFTIEDGWDYLDGLSSGAEIEKNCIIRSGTVVYEGVSLEEGVATGHYALIREKSTVGRRSLIGSYATLDGEVHIGEYVRIQTGVYLPHGTVVEDRVFFGPHVVVTNDKYPPSKRLAGVKVCKNAVIGAGAILIAGVTIGENSVVGAGAVVTKDVPENVLVTGIPAKFRCRIEEFEAKKREYEKT